MFLAAFPLGLTYYDTDNVQTELLCCVKVIFFVDITVVEIITSF